jgi:Cu-Zn family superoxide dismutase
MVMGLVMALPLALGCEPMTTDPTAAAEGTQQSALHTRIRTAVLRNAAGTVVSRVVFTSIGGGKTLVSATVNFPGIRAGFHGYHIHGNDNPANGDGCVADPAMPANTHFVSADGHWNPTAATHGQHAGDMPNVMVLTDGSGFLSFTNQIDPLSDIVGRAVILHEGIDNHGNIPVGTAANQYTANSPEAITLTQNTGNAGNRIGCGLIQ